MKASRMFALVLMGATFAPGCYYWRDGPEYSPVTPPSGFAVVTVYRPKKQTGAAQTIEASQPGRTALLCAGSYATFVVPAGHVTMTSAINQWHSTMIVALPGAPVLTTNEEKPTSRSIELDAADGESYFIRTEFDGFKDPPLAEVVARAEAEDDLDGLSMAPGGRARFPVQPFAKP